MRTIVIADYRWKGHRLGPILATAVALTRKGDCVYLHLPWRAYGSTEWRVQSLEHRANVGVLPAEVDVAKDIAHWLEEVIQESLKVRAEYLLFPWADALLEHLHRFRGIDSMPHIHLLLGRCPPGWRDQRGSEASQVHRKVNAIDGLTADGFVCVGSLCAAFDCLAGKSERYEGGGEVRWVADPVPVGKELATTQADARDRIGLKMDRRYALVVGDLSSRKRVTETVRAWQRVYRRSGITLILAGRVDRTAKHVIGLSRAVRQQTPGSLETNFGYLSNEMFVNYVKATDVLICMYRSGTNMSSGTVGVAAATRTPIFVGGNRYLERVVAERGLGVIGDVEAPKAAFALSRACELRVKGIAPDAIGYTKFHKNWLGGCISIT